MARLKRVGWIINRLFRLGAVQLALRVGGIMVGKAPVGGCLVAAEAAAASFDQEWNWKFGAEF